MRPLNCRRSMSQALAQSCKRCPARLATACSRPVSPRRRLFVTHSRISKWALAKWGRTCPTWCSGRSSSAVLAVILLRARKALANKVQNIRGSADVLLDCAGLTFEELQPVADAMEKGGCKAAAKAVTDEMLRKVCAIAGTPDECIARIEEYRAAGCTNIMLEIWGDDRTGQAKLFGEAVLPHFRN